MDMIDLHFAESAPLVRARVEAYAMQSSMIPLYIRLEHRHYGAAGRTYRSSDSKFVLKVYDSMTTPQEWAIYSLVSAYSATPYALLSFDSRRRYAILLSYEGEPYPFDQYIYADR